MKRVWWTLLGGFVGVLLAILATAVVTMQSIRQNPGDPSAGSVAICIIGFLPVGFIAGLVLGLVASRTKVWDDVPLTNEESLTRRNTNEVTVFFRTRGTEKAGGYYEILVLTLKSSGDFRGCGHGSVGPVYSIDN